MGLILIPHEEVKTKSNKSKSFVKSGNCSESKQSLVDKIRQKLRLKETSRDEKIVGKTCIELIRYTQNSDKLSTKDLNNLVTNLHRTTLSIQRKKKEKMDKRKRG